jgi:hypothetical protein
MLAPQQGTSGPPGTEGEPMRKLATILLGMAALWAPTAARAVPVALYINEAESRLQLTSGTLGVSLVPGYGGSRAILTLGPQAGTTGTSAGTLPGGGTSDGLITSLAGQLLLDADPATSGSFQFDSRASFIAPGVSGNWLPDATQSGAAAPAQAGTLFADVNLGIDGRAALRDLFASAEGYFFRAAAGTNTWTFTGDGQFHPLVGSFDYVSGIPGVSGGAAFGTGRNPLRFRPMAGAMYEILPGGVSKLTLPFAGNMNIGPFAITSGIPVNADLEFSGVIVAYSVPQVPEPGAAVLLGVAFVGILGALRRGRNG